MTITVDQLIAAINQKNGFPLEPEQEIAVRHNNGPLWIIAGPGTGKTEVLVVRTLKLVCCDGVDPASIIVTTFTEKAARNLEDRIIDALNYVAKMYPDLPQDISQLRIGTLHSLCNEILLEFRYTEYQNLRLLDDVETNMLIADNLAWTASHNAKELESQFSYLFGTKNNPRWDWTRALKILLDRLVEDQLDITKLKAQGGPWTRLAEINDKYESILKEKYSCDFPRLQRYFLDFLKTQQGQLFINGDGNQRPPIQHVLVDEYQDTNPIQEEIYFTLTQNSPHNLTVVGDDDQALYRFRGATVECMVEFDSQCKNRWAVAPKIVTLLANHRSHTKIIEFCNEFIKAFPVMQQPLARAAKKKDLVPKSGINGNYHAVGLIKGNNITDLAVSLADTVNGLVNNGIIQDYSQAVLLLRSTKNSPNNAGKYLSVLEQAGIPVYNPRSKDLLEQREIREMLGAFISILDPGLSSFQAMIKDQKITAYITDAVATYLNIASSYPKLVQYVERSQDRIQNKLNPNDNITQSVVSIFYRILAHEPFTQYQRMPDKDLRLSKLSRLLEDFTSQYGRPLNMDSSIRGSVNRWWLKKFYELFIGYLVHFGMDDDEDDEVICPPGMFPIMTVHQSKGLEFDFVFVASLGHPVKTGAAHYLEKDIRQFRLRSSTVIHKPEDAAWHDDVRYHYVAYSRARYALIFLATESQLRQKNTASFSANLVRQHLARL